MEKFYQDYFNNDNNLFSFLVIGKFVVDNLFIQLDLSSFFLLAFYFGYYFSKIKRDGLDSFRKS